MSQALAAARPRRLIVRSETVADYPAISDVHAVAFDSQAGEPLIVAMLRQRQLFDPELSLVAELEGRVVGHVLFTPQAMRLLDVEVRAVMLSPVGVLPDFQRQGVGSTLIEEGHRIAAAKGYAFSWLVGIPDYYPRFGYRQRAYGSWMLTMETSGEPSLDEAPLKHADIPALRELWQLDRAAVDFAGDPGPLLIDWVSPNPHIQSLVFRQRGEIVGFAFHDDRCRTVRRRCSLRTAR